MVALLYKVNAMASGSPYLTVPVDPHYIITLRNVDLCGRFRVSSMQVHSQACGQATPTHAGWSGGR